MFLRARLLAPEEGAAAGFGEAVLVVHRPAARAGRQVGAVGVDPVVAVGATNRPASGVEERQPAQEPDRDPPAGTQPSRRA